MNIERKWFHLVNITIFYQMHGFFSVNAKKKLLLFFRIQKMKNLCFYLKFFFYHHQVFYNFNKKALILMKSHSKCLWLYNPLLQGISWAERFQSDSMSVVGTNSRKGQSQFISYYSSNGKQAALWKIADSKGRIK